MLKLSVKCEDEKHDYEEHCVLLKLASLNTISDVRIILNSMILRLYYVCIILVSMILAH